ncbi:MAG: hypothetical protein ACI4SR_09030 [Faecalibacillus sp.]
MDYYLQIADITILLKLSHKIVINESFFPFIINNCKKDYVIDFINIEQLPVLSDNNLIFTNLLFSIYCKDHQYIRIFHDHKENDEKYAILYEEQNKSQVYYIKKYDFAFSETLNTFSHIGLENIFMKFNAFILHSSCLNWNNKGILFTGPSGIGKSTQANLWEKYEGAELINGDRTIIRYLDGWNGYGSPYAGSSRCFKNKKVQINCIVVLNQDKTNTIKQLKSIEAFKKIYSQMIINSWDKMFVDKIIHFINDLINDIPVYYLSCTPDHRAVELLKSTIEEND